jgi:RNA polymerase sigma-70 factor, ECF subfamily
MNTTRMTLLEQLRQPENAEAWNYFVVLYRPLLLAWARRLNVPPTDADDLVQEVLVVLLARLPEFERRNVGSFRAWLRAITHNKWVELQRRRRPEALGERDTAAPDPAEQFWETEFRQCLLARALELMKSEFQEKTWQAVVQLILEDKKPAEVAAALDMTVGAVRSARFRVLGGLRQHLAGMLDDD